MFAKQQIRRELMQSLTPFSGVTWHGATGDVVQVYVRVVDFREQEQYAIHAEPATDAPPDPL